MRHSPLSDADGRVVGLTSTERDVSRLKETERRLRAADRQKDEFLAMLGHELRNPLSSIRSAAELLKLSDIEDPEIRRTQVILERQSAHMARLLDGLLDVSRIINGKIVLERSVLDVVDVCREVLGDCADRARRTRARSRGEGFPSGRSRSRPIASASCRSSTTCSRTPCATRPRAARSR